MCDTTMGVITSKILNPGCQEIQYEADEVTGLSANDKRILASTFKTVNKDQAKAGERLFIIFFTKYPQHQQYFKDFKDKSIEELAGTPKLIAHGSNVFATLSNIIFCLDKPEVLVELLLKTGYNHGRHHMNPVALKDLKVALVTLFQESLKDAMTEQVAEVWVRAIDVILSTFQKGMKAYDEIH